MDDQGYTFLDLMFNCTDKLARNYVAKMASAVINKAYSIFESAKDKEHPKIKALRETSEKFITLCVDALKTKEC